MRVADPERNSFSKLMTAKVDKKERHARKFSRKKEFHKRTFLPFRIVLFFPLKYVFHYLSVLQWPLHGYLPSRKALVKLRHLYKCTRPHKTPYV